MEKKTTSLPFSAAALVETDILQRKNIQSQK